MPAVWVSPGAAGVTAQHELTLRGPHTFVPTASIHWNESAVPAHTHRLGENHPLPLEGGRIKGLGDIL